jgi:alkaline phosphatase
MYHYLHGQPSGIGDFLLRLRDSRKDRSRFSSRELIYEQQVGYSHPLGISVDLMLGGGRCYFQPQGESGSCRTHGIDLFAHAEEQGYYTARDLASFDVMKLGLGNIQLPYVGLFKDEDLSYEVDRQQQPPEVRERSLSRASADNEKGYIMMIEASHIDNASHAHGSVAHLHDVLEFNRVVDIVMK